MKTLISLCCDDIIRDAETNSISIHSIVEEISGEGFPMVFPRFCIFYLFQKETGDINSKGHTLIISLDEKELHKLPLIIDFQEKEKCRNIIKIGGFAFLNPGMLKIELKDEDRLLSLIELKVSLRTTVKIEPNGSK